MKLAAGLGVLMVAVVLAPGSAIAKRGYFVFDASQTMEAHVRGSKGFGFSLSANGRQVDLTISGHNASMQYGTSGSNAKRRIEAKFGGLGRVSMGFRPTARPRLVPEPDGNCRGKGELVQPGMFVGTFEFEGEHGYTAAHATRARGKITRKMKEICKNTGGEEGSPTSIHWTLLHAQTAGGEISVIALATESASRPAFDGSAFSATLVEFHRRGMSIFRTIESDADLDGLSVVKSHGRIISATIEPPAPFSGSATYLRSPGSPSESWTGSLAGDFPGVGTVSLAGPEFCAEGVTFASCRDSTQVAVSSGS
jgi:hypothetical protein